MYVIAGLGNPGKEYEKTRHNMGFLVLDILEDEWGIPVTRNKHNALVGKGEACGKQVMLVRPLTYMNDSGRSLGEIMRYYDVADDELIVIYDDMDLDPGEIRIRKKGSAGSHNGMKSIISHLGDGTFPRVRVGIGRPDRADWKDFVLGRISPEDEEKTMEGVRKAADAVTSILSDGIDRAMNRYNRRAEKEPEGREE